MDYKDLLKKYWFVGVIGVLLIVFIVVWTIDNNANKSITPTVQTKEVNGKYSLFEIDGNPYTADDFYELVDTSSSTGIAIDDLMTIFADKEIKATDKIKALAANNAQYYVINYTPEQLDQLMRNNGLKKYGNITTYFESVIKKQELIKKYLTDHTEDIVNPYIEGKKKVSHILIKVADVSETTDENGNTIHTANPTEEETTKLNNVLEALKTKTFGEVALEFSEDSTASYNGYLGCQFDSDISTQYVKEFADTAVALNYGEQSDVITTQYGYHIILVEEPKADDLLEIETFVSELANANNSEYYIRLLIEYSEKYKVEILNDDINELFNNYRDAEETDESEVTE